MKYEFPNIDRIDQVREAIEGRDEFIIAERDGFVVVNYNVNLKDTFPCPDTKDEELNRKYMLRRECRGLKFNTWGKVIARPYHKFFNLNEKPETSVVDLDQGFEILDKLDGSMIHPMFLDHQLVWCTKMGITDIGVAAGEFAIASGYEEFARDVLNLNLTPIFEYCSRMNKIVIKYEEEMLILTAMRHNVTGEYIPYKTMKNFADGYGVPVVGSWAGGFPGLTDFVNEVVKREEEEGYVFRMPDGHMMKIKNEWYVQLHKTMDMLRFDKHVWNLVLDNNHDDAKAFMDDEDKRRIDAIADDIHKGINDLTDRLKWEIIAWTDNHGDSAKKFAVGLVNNPERKFAYQEKSLLFQIKADMDRAHDIVFAFIRKHTTTQKQVEILQAILNVKRWEDY